MTGLALVLLSLCVGGLSIYVEEAAYSFLMRLDGARRQR